jgi:hypothetical protein
MGSQGKKVILRMAQIIAQTTKNPAQLDAPDSICSQFEIIRKIQPTAA